MRAERLRKLVCAIFVFATALVARGPDLPPLPELKLGATFDIVQRQVNEAYVRARAHPTDAAANGKLGMVLDAYEQYDSAALCYRRAHALDPKSFEWMYDLGWVEFKQGQYDEAAETLAAALALRPDDFLSGREQRKLRHADPVIAEDLLGDPLVFGERQPQRAAAGERDSLQFQQRRNVLV